MPFLTAARRLWPQTLLGVIFAVWLWRVAPGALWYGAPMILGLTGSIPLAMVTAHPWVGRALAAAGLCRIPEETRLHAEPERAGLFTPFAQTTAAAAAK